MKVSGHVAEFARAELCRSGSCSGLGILGKIRISEVESFSGNTRFVF